MVNRYLQSEEEYMGYNLKVVMTKLDQTMRFHKTCEVWKDGKRIATGKTKKEMKEQIAEGYI